MYYEYMIMVWPFDKAPPEWRALSPHGGDEDWVALVPLALKDAWIPWLEYGGFGVSEITKHELPSGATVYIGAHS